MEFVLPGTLVLCLLVTVYAADWSYTGDAGPSRWTNHYKQCGGQKQSPIDVVTKHVIYTPSLGSFQLTGFDNIPTGATWKLKNNGHTAQVDISGDYVAEGGGLPGRYKLRQFHFHWGSTDDTGSEHLIDGKPFPLEMHMVFHSTDHANLTEAMDKPEGLAVFSFGFKVASSNNANLDNIVDELSSVTHGSDNSVSIDPFNFGDVLPNDLSKFYRYEGSLTTPTCYESVVWTLFEQQIYISGVQLAEYRTLFTNEAGQPDVPLVDIFRPVQDLNGRTVRSSNDVYEGNSAISVVASFTCIFSAFMLMTLLTSIIP